MFEFVEYEEVSVKNYALSFRPIFMGSFGTLVGFAATQHCFEEWLKERAAEGMLGVEDIEKFEFSVSFYHYGPTSLEVVEGIYSFVIHLLALPAFILSEIAINLVRVYKPGLELQAELELSQFLLIHINIAFYLMLGYWVSRKI